VPVRLRGELPAISRAAGWFPIVGALVGAGAGAIGWLARPTLGPTVAAILAIALLVVATGALHQDGLADCADGLGIRADRQRRLAVMRDSTIGTFGALALLVWFALIVSAVAGVDRDHGWRTLIAIGASSRWAALIHARATTPARSDGLGAGFAVTTPGLAFATITAALVTLAAAGFVDGLLAMWGAAAVALLLAVWARGTLGGRTGDTLGATVAIAEAVVAVILLGVIAQ